MLRKKLFVLLSAFFLVFLFGFSSLGLCSAQPSAVQGGGGGKVKVYASGKEVVFDRGADPFFHKGMLYVPIRNVLETGGVVLSWDAETKTAKFSRGPHNVKMEVLAETLWDNDKACKIEFIVKNGRLFVPIRNFCSSLNMKFRWLPEVKEARVCVACLDLEQ